MGECIAFLFITIWIWCSCMLNSQCTTNLQLNPHFLLHNKKVKEVNIIFQAASVIKLPIRLILLFIYNVSSLHPFQDSH